MAVGGVFDPSELERNIADVEDMLYNDEKELRGGFRVGNVVLLKSGGPAMTVMRLTKNSHIECVWFDDRECKHGVFAATEITKVAE